MAKQDDADMGERRTGDGGSGSGRAGDGENGGGDHRLPPARACPPAPVALTRRQIVSGLASGAVVAFAGAGLSGCQTNAALGRRQMMLVSDGQLAALAAGVWRQVLARTPRYADARLRRVGQRIVAAALRQYPGSGLDRHRWEFVAFRDDQVNAWVMPGGKVGFYAGILDIMENDDQVATVMGHEVGHVVARHAAERFSQQMLSQVGVTVVAAALSRSDDAYADEIAAVLGAGVTFGILLPYSRQHEYEADRLGIDFMIGGDYAAPEALRFWKAMVRHAGRRRLPEFMSTHPLDANRVAAMRRHLAARGVV